MRVSDRAPLFERAMTRGACDMSLSLVIVIPTAGRADVLGRTLASLARLAMPAAYRYTLVVENGPRGDAERVARAAGESMPTRYLYVDRPSKSVALNAALDGLNDELVVFLDDDVRPATALINAYAAAAERERSATAAPCFFGGPFGVDYEQAPPDWLRRYLPRSARGWERTGDPKRDGQPFLGFNWAAYARDVKAHGGFDVDRGPGAASGITVGDETLLQRRMLAAGMRQVYVPEARVWHYVPADRCSPAWVLDRNFRHGMAKGLQTRHQRPAVAGYPLYVLRRYVQGVGLGLIEAATFNPRRRFNARHRHAFNRGLIQGLRKGREQDAAKSTPPAPATNTVAAAAGGAP